ncbi:MAG: type 1 fimbrial protein [Budvicia sp.]|nr:type 1 fimbrial protein [Budvicia sp.]
MKLAANLVSRSKGYIGLLGRLMLGALALVTFETQAAITCGMKDPTYYRDINIPIMGPGIATVGEDLAIGLSNHVHAQTYTLTSDSGYEWKCNRDWNDPATTVQGFYRVQAISMPYGPPVLIGSTSVFPTNVPGIGMTFTERVSHSTSENNQFPVKVDSALYVLESPSSSVTAPGYSGEGIFYVRLFKTGPIAPGNQQVLASSFPVFQASVGIISPVAFEKAFWTIRFSGAINIVSKTCQAEDVDVDLGSHQLADFPKAGSVSEWKDFNITLKNCPPFHGYAFSASSYYYHEDGILTGDNRRRENTLDMAFASVYGNYNLTVANIEGGAGAAEGFGIQLAINDGSTVILSPPYTYNQKRLGITLTTSDGANYTIPLKARYYRYGSKPKAGKANGAITYTVNYY